MTVKDIDAAELADSLDFYRNVVVGKVAGLTREQATRHTMPSGTTLLGIVQHLALVEDEWFGHVLLGGDAPEWDIDASFVVPDGASVDDVLAGYTAACDRSRVALASVPSLEEPTKAGHWYFGVTTARFVLWHMVKETARHAGHLDILRELTDGATGYG